MLNSQFHAVKPSFTYENNISINLNNLLLNQLNNIIINLKFKCSIIII